MSERTLFAALPARQLAWVREQLHNETISGGLVLLAAAIAMIWANSPWAESYASFINAIIGPAWGHLAMSVKDWASAGASP